MFKTMCLQSVGDQNKTAGLQIHSLPNKVKQLSFPFSETPWRSRRHQIRARGRNLFTAARRHEKPSVPFHVTLSCVYCTVSVVLDCKQHIHGFHKANGINRMASAVSGRGDRLHLSLIGWDYKNGMIREKKKKKKSMVLLNKYHTQISISQSPILDWVMLSIAIINQSHVSMVLSNCILL